MLGPPEGCPLTVCSPCLYIALTAFPHSPSPPFPSPPPLRWWHVCDGASRGRPDAHRRQFHLECRLHRRWVGGGVPRKGGGRGRGTWRRGGGLPKLSHSDLLYRSMELYRSTVLPSSACRFLKETPEHLPPLPLPHLPLPCLQTCEGNTSLLPYPACRCMRATPPSRPASSPPTTRRQTEGDFGPTSASHPPSLAR